MRQTRARAITLAAAFLLAFASGLLAQAPVAQAPAKRPITAQDLWAFQRVGGPVLSPDGKTVVFTVTEWSVPKNKSTSSLWLVDFAGGEPRRLTQGGSDGAPAWSPDGRRIAFVSKRGDDDSPALYIIAPGGGEARRVASVPYGFKAPKWLSNNRVAALTQVIPELAGKLEKSDLDAMRKEMKRRKDSLMTARVTEERQFRYWDRVLAEGVADKLVAVDAETGALTDLTPDWKRLFSTVMDPGFDVSPDGKSIAMTINATPPPYRERTNLDVYVITADGSGAMRDLTATNPFTDDSPRFSPDGKFVYYAREAKYTAGNARIARIDLATGTSAILTGAYDRSFGAVSFSGDSRTLFVGSEDRGSVPIFRMAADGTGLTKLYGEGTSTGLAVAAGSIVFLNESSSRPAELCAWDSARGTVRRLTKFNDAFLATLDLGKTESRQFRGAAGDTVQMFVTYPPASSRTAGKSPLVQILHGGPHTMFRDDFGYRWNQHVFASPGYVVARVNRHGSTGFGEAFVGSIDGNWGEKPTEDILTATDVIVKDDPAIDGEKVAAAGASYGGYLAAWLLGHTDRFKCLVNHAGVNDFITEYGSDVTSYGFDADVWGGTPWKDASAMQKNNPMSYASSFKTPMLISCGEQDYRVPYGNSLSLYGVLQAMNVPSRLVIFPNENHWILTPQNSIYWNYEVQSWLARYIGGKPMEKPVFSEEKP
jgi:dipeptidyl aminopeptidase/acylaminoacyl peptidase